MYGSTLTPSRAHLHTMRGLLARAPRTPRARAHPTASAPAPRLAMRVFGVVLRRGPFGVAALITTLSQAKQHSGNADDGRAARVAQGKRLTARGGAGRRWSPPAPRGRLGHHERRGAPRARSRQAKPQAKEVTIGKPRARAHPAYDSDEWRRRMWPESVEAPTAEVVYVLGVLATAASAEVDVAYRSRRALMLTLKSEQARKRMCTSDPDLGGVHLEVCR